jgi:hypothetical protein
MRAAGFPVPPFTDHYERFLPTIVLRIAGALAAFSKPASVVRQ